MAEEEKKIEGKTAKEWFDEGVKKAEAEQWNAAIERFTNAIKLSPDSAVAYSNLGATWSKKGEHDKAIPNFNKAIELNPDDAKAYNNRGVVWNKKGEWDKAMADYNKAIELKSDYAEAYNNRGSVWGEKDELDRAIADYNKAIELKSDYADAYNNRGAAWNKKGEWDNAIKDFNKAIELNHDHAKAYYNLGVVWDAKGEYDEAIKNYDKAIELDPNYAEAYNNLGVAWGKKGEYDEAIKDFDKAIELKPDNVSAISNRGKAILERETKKLAGKLGVSIENLEERRKEEKDKARRFGWVFYLVLVFFTLICLVFAGEILDKAGFFGVLSLNVYIPLTESLAFAIVSFPFIWALRRIKTAQENAEVLSELFSNLIFIEERIFFFTQESLDDWQKKIYEPYFQKRIERGPEEVLLEIFQGKRDDPPATPLQLAQDLLENGIKFPNKGKTKDSSTN